MIKKIFLILLILTTLISPSFSTSNIYISASIDDEIITNLDVEKEGEYLKILNPELNQVSNNRVLDLAKTSLIKEIIKKKEISKFRDLSDKNPLVEGYLKNLYSKLNYNNETEFSNDLKKGNNYSINQIKEKLKIELFWNQLIYKRYKTQVKIDNDKLIKKINNISNKSQKQYFLSEIVFKKKKDVTLDSIVNEIKLSINEIGFNNTANIYSISESSNLGGKLGWINENGLSEKISTELNKIKEGEYTDLIQISNNYLILKIDQIKIDEVKIDKDKELKNLVQIETNKQLNQFSRIYFNKSKINYSINEK